MMARYPVDAQMTGVPGEGGEGFQLGQRLGGGNPDRGAQEQGVPSVLQTGRRLLHVGRLEEVGPRGAPRGQQQTVDPDHLGRRTADHDPRPLAAVRRLDPGRGEVGGRRGRPRLGLVLHLDQLDGRRRHRVVVGQRAAAIGRRRRRRRRPLPPPGPGRGYDEPRVR